MNEQITIGAASLMGSLALGTVLVRWAVSPTPTRGQHRAPRVRQVEVSLDELLGEWEPVYGDALARARALRDEHTTTEGEL